MIISELELCVLGVLCGEIVHFNMVFNIYMKQLHFPTGYLFSIFLSPHHLFPVSPMNKGFAGKEQQLHLYAVSFKNCFSQ